MDLIWGAMIIISIISAIITGRVEATVTAVFDGAKSSVGTLLALAGAMCFWTGLMRIAERSGISGFIARLISPVLRLLFPKCSDTAREHISMNITANLLGMGNAATPAGMLAAEALDKENPTPEVPSVDLSMLVVLNTTAFQLVPSTIIALRAAAGSENAVSVMVPIWFASAAAVTAGALSVKLMGRLTKCST